MENSKNCPCGQPKTLGECCGRFITDGEAPATAEELMRSRYTAFALHEVDYIVQTHHPDTRGEVNRDEIKRWSEGARWLGLEILRTEDGQPGEDQGWVEFIARFAEKGETKTHHELSFFQRHQGRWSFHSAHPPKQTPTQRAQPKVGRNEPCPCGSGKKYKKCCGLDG